MRHPPSSQRRQRLEAEGIRFIDLREWIIKRLFVLMLYVEPTIAIALCRDMAKGGDES